MVFFILITFFFTVERHRTFGFVFHTKRQQDWLLGKSTWFFVLHYLRSCSLMGKFFG